MIKKFERYWDTLSYKEANKIVTSLTIIAGTIIFTLLYQLVFKHLDSSNDFFILLLWLCILGSIILSIYCILSSRLGLDYKSIIESRQKVKTELEKIFNTSDNNIIEVIPCNFPEDLFSKNFISFYLNEKDTKFWMKLEECEDSDKISAKIYFSDKDNPNKKIECPRKITNPIYVINNFKFKN